MAVTFMIPAPLRPLVRNQEKVSVDKGRTVGDAIKGLIDQFGDLQKHLYTDEGKLRSFVNFYLNDEDIRSLGGDDAKINDGDTISIIPSIAGGIQ